MQEISCQEQFEATLAVQGYLEIKGKPQEIGIFYRLENHFIQVIISIDYHRDFWLEPIQIVQIKERVRTLFLHPEGRIPKQEKPYSEDIRFFCIFWAAHSQGSQELVQSESSSWWVDLSQKSLRVYEHQPGDFYGIRGFVEEALGATAAKEKSLSIKELLSGYPIVNLSIIILNILVFLVLEFLGNTNDGGFMLAHGAMYPEAIIFQHQWFRLFTCMFLHFGITHIGNNMLMLFFLGANLERAMGRVKYGVLYLLAGLGGSAVSLYGMLKTGDYAVSAGASGAIFGVIGALLYVVIRNKGRLEELTTKRLIFMACLSLYYGFTATGVDNLAHVGGLLSGFLLGILLYRKIPETENSDD